MLAMQASSADWVFAIGIALLAIALVAARRSRIARIALLVIPLVTLALLIGLAPTSGRTGFVNWLITPARLFIIASVALVWMITFYRTWTRPVVAIPLAIVLVALFAIGLTDTHFKHLVLEPDNIAIVLMLAALLVVLWSGFRHMAITDAQRDAEKPIDRDESGERLMTWPYLLLAELVIMLVATAGLIVWALLVPAPLEPPADPTHVPNPAKAPWYFLGLQELLIYFDPWIAGVMLPILAVVGLCLIPYLDCEPQPAGIYTLKPRRLGITVFLFGFLILWIVPILTGTFLRGPNWASFGPFEPWHGEAVEPVMSVNLSSLVWGTPLTESGSEIDQDSPRHPLLRELPSLLLVLVWFAGLPLVAKRTVFRDLAGGWRYAVFTFLLAAMALLPMKMLARWLLGLKYFVALPEWSINL